VSPTVDYERHGRTYGLLRRTDPRIAAHVHAALGDARTVLNVGAGTGSYEPGDRWVLAVEPSATMRAQRPPDAAPAIDARAEALPLDDRSVDAAMACVTIHHWQPPATGLAEMRRVARGRVVVLTFNLDGLAAWQKDFLREGLGSRARTPSQSRAVRRLAPARRRRTPLKDTSSRRLCHHCFSLSDRKTQCSSRSTPHDPQAHRVAAAVQHSSV
jgi:SAM-dependent methyltransferase